MYLGVAYKSPESRIGVVDFVIRDVRLRSTLQVGPCASAQIPVGPQSLGHAILQVGRFCLTDLIAT
jgi:hypothetical protein